MDVPSKKKSNTEKLFDFVNGFLGETFSDKCRAAIEDIDARMKDVGSASPEWHRLIQSKGQIEGFIRHDRAPSFDWYEEPRAVAA